MKLLEEMQCEDIDAALAVIDSQDDDDAQAAEPGYRQIGGCLDQYVFRHEGNIIGVTGFATPPGCDQSYWLSWTYVHADYANQGYGRNMLNELIDHLRQRGGRELFVKVSDYESEEDGAIYAAALHLYQSLGFQIEITHNDYYDAGEAQIILGLRLKEASPIPNKIKSEKVAVKFNAVYEIAETEGAYTFGWNEEGKAVFSREDVLIGIDAVREKKGRAIFLSFPSNFEDVREPLLSAGFEESGCLRDYYEDGIHDQHYRYRTLSD